MTTKESTEVAVVDAEETVTAVTYSDVALQKTLTEAKTLLVRTFPFLAFIVISTKYQIMPVEDDPAIKTMGAGMVGVSPIVYINQEFLMEKLTNVHERTFVIAHELLHIFFQHFGYAKLKGWDHQLFNIAADYFINYLIDSLESPHLAVPEFGVLLDEKYADMSSNEIYLKLLEESDGEPQKALGNFDAPGEPGGNSALDEIPQEGLSNDQRAELRASLSASLNNCNMPGNVRNSALVSALYDLLEPTQPWREVLADFVTKARNEYYSYSRYNSRSGEIIMPSSTGDKINLLFGVDTSGSMTDENLAEALTELNAIVNDFENWKITFVTCEMEVEQVGEYSSEIGDDFSSFSQDFIKGGGTDMNPIIMYSETLEEEPDAIIIITDGFLSEKLIETHLPVVVVVVRGGIETLDTNHTVIYIDD